MKLTSSGDYVLPGRFRCELGNIVLRLARFVPRPLRNKFRENHVGYQVFDGMELGNSEGATTKKWEALRLPANLEGKAVLDIGCAEGFFSRQCAKAGARPVVGLDTSLARLMCGSFMAMQENLDIRYRIAVFPNVGHGRQYDYVICLSVLHHSLVNKDLWKVLTLPDLESDRKTLRQQLGVLRSLTKPGGRAIIEMPFEYDDPLERNVVDFERFNGELLKAGFARGQFIGSWEYNPKYQQLKDRCIYVAEA